MLTICQGHHKDPWRSWGLQDENVLSLPSSNPLGSLAKKVRQQGRTLSLGKHTLFNLLKLLSFFFFKLQDTCLPFSPQSHDMLDIVDSKRL